MFILANICIIISVFLDTSAYAKQGLKIIHTKNSRDVSTSSLYIRFWKDVFVICSCLPYSNFIGAGLAAWGLTCCAILTIITIKYKPQKWKKSSNLSYIIEEIL